jgi:ATP/maltotriose-dependent transcriptional regulator MalT
MIDDTRQLSHREMDVLACLVVGMSNREIAAELNVSVGTVKSHLTSMYWKLEVANRTQAALAGSKLFPMLLAPAT